jgi:DNA-binding CsgD family transcriptional regulator
MHLTPRELDVLKLMAAGSRNAEIAGLLFVSENTVESHCRRIFRKLNVRSRLAAVQSAKGVGYVPPRLPEPGELKELCGIAGLNWRS